MKKLDFIASLNYLSDDTVSEAEAGREQTSKRHVPAVLKYCAIAACAGIVIMSGILIGKNANLRIGRNEFTVSTEDSSINPLPIDNGELMQIPMPTDYTGSGSGGFFARDISEVEFKGLSADGTLPETLPVYKNSVKWYAGMYPEHTDYDKMLETLKKYAELYGFDVENLDITEYNPVESGEDMTDELFEEVYGIPAPDGVYQPQVLEAAQNGVTVRVIGDYLVNISFENGDVIEGYDFSDRESVLAAAKYLRSEYSDKLMLTKPEILITGGTRDVYGERSYGILIYEAADSPSEELYNRSFRGISFGLSDDGRLVSVSYDITDTENSVGDYPLITPEEAVSQFESGNYINASESDERDAQKVERVELVYRGSKTDEYYIPCYRLTVYQEDAPIESQMSMKLYNTYYVPAIEPRFIEGSETSAEVKALKPFSASDIPSYQNVGYYDGVMRDAKPATSADESLEELFSDRDFNAQIGSFYKVRVYETLDGSDALWLNGYTTGAHDDQATFYRATVLYDYFAEKAMYKDIIFRMAGSVKMQESGSPPFTSGDEVALLLFRDSEVSDFNRAFKCYAFVYDVEHIDGGEYLLARGQRVPELEDGLTDYMTDETASIVTSSTYNPAVYHGAYDPSELAKKLKEIVDGAEKTPLENLSEGRFGPGVLGFGGSFKEEPIEAETLEAAYEPVYRDVEISEPEPATGEPQSFEELLQAKQDLGDKLRGVAYEITNVYTYEEAVNIYEEFNPHRTLYRAHAFYDVINDCPLNYYFDVAGWGSEQWQDEGRPVYAVGDRLLSFFGKLYNGYELPDSYTEFMLFEVGGVKMAYHIGKENIRFEGREYPNLDLEMPESERKVVTTTENNPIIFTQKSTLQSLSDFMRDKMSFYGIVSPENKTLETFTVVPQEYSLGVSGDICSIEELSNPDRENLLELLDFTEEITVPVYKRKMWRNLPLNGMIENVDRDFMREALRFYAIGFGFDPNSIEIEEDRLTQEELEKLEIATHSELPEEYCEPTRMSFEKDGVEVEICVTDSMVYKVYISIADGFNLPEGAKVGFYDGATRQEAENAEPELLRRYEWLLGFNDAGRTYVNGTEDGSCYVSMYHPLAGYEYIPDEDGNIPKENSEDVIRSIINKSLFGVDFMDDGFIHCNGIPGVFEAQYEKLGDYPMITPKRALELLDEGKYVWTSFEEAGKTSSDVEYIELVYGSDGVPYYKLYCSAKGWRSFDDGDYAAYYVPAVEPQYVEISDK